VDHRDEGRVTRNLGQMLVITQPWGVQPLSSVRVAPPAPGLEAAVDEHGFVGGQRRGMFRGVRELTRAIDP